MVIITVLVLVVFAIMVHSMLRHHQSSGFNGPAGLLQWFWFCVPFAILLGIDVVLMDGRTLPEADNPASLAHPRNGMTGEGLQPGTAPPLAPQDGMRMP